MSNKRIFVQNTEEMLQVKRFVFNSFQVNTYIVFNEKGSCAIIDAANDSDTEDRMLADFIEKNGLKPVYLLNTHAHIDHILGNDFVAEKYGLQLAADFDGNKYLDRSKEQAVMFGFRLKAVVKPNIALSDKQTLMLDEDRLQVLLAPGHADGSLCFYSEADGFVITGDVLFDHSIGRTDLPGGSFETLQKSIITQLYTLPDETIVFPGHGPQTTIGIEKRENPYVRAL